MRAAGPAGDASREGGSSTAAAREASRAAAKWGDSARVSVPGPARSIGATPVRRTPPSPSRLPPTKSATACAVSPSDVTRSAAGFELLNDALGQVQRLVGGHDAAVGSAHVENDGVVPRRADALD